MKFEKIIIPPGWQESFTKYPNGRTIFEALTSTITSVNEGIEAVNTKVDQGLLAIDAAANTIRSEVAASFLILQNKLEQDIEYLQDDLVADISVLQSQVNAAVASVADKVTQSQLDAVNAQLADIENDIADKAQKLKATNLVTNGDFSQGEIGWGGVGTTNTITVTDKISFNGNASLSGGRHQDINANTNDKLYLAFKHGNVGTVKPNVFYANKGTFNNMSNLTFVSGQNSLIFNSRLNGIRLYLQQESGQIYDQAWLDDFIVINLTATFGAGNEPTKEQMDRLLAEFPNSWFDGTQEILPLKFVSQLIDEIANKEQESWQSPTLLNGWTGDIKYRKQDDGIVIIKFTNVTVPATAVYNQDIFSLPAGYYSPAFTAAMFLIDTVVSGKPTESLKIVGSTCKVSSLRVGTIISGCGFLVTG